VKPCRSANDISPPSALIRRLHLHLHLPR